MKNNFINVLVYSGSDMRQDYEFFCTDATKEEVIKLYIEMERYNNGQCSRNPLEKFEEDHFYNIISSSDMFPCLHLIDIKQLKIDLQIDLDDIYELFEIENNIISKYCE